MKADRWGKYEAKKKEIGEHFKKQRRKAFIIWGAVEIAGLTAAWLFTGSENLQWFLVALFFIGLFPTTMLSKKLKELTKLEKSQLLFAEQEQ